MVVPEYIGATRLHTLPGESLTRLARWATNHDSEAIGERHPERPPQRYPQTMQVIPWSLVAAYWSPIARLAVIPWSLVAHTNSRLKKPSNSLRDQTPNCARRFDRP